MPALLGCYQCNGASKCFVLNALRAECASCEHRRDIAVRERGEHAVRCAISRSHILASRLSVIADRPYRCKPLLFITKLSGSEMNLSRGLQPNPSVVAAEQQRGANAT
jgi:hypothetical protein